MTTDQLDPPGTLYPPADPAPRSRIWLRLAVALVVALLAAGLTFVISDSVSATYRASTQLQIAVAGQNGLGQDAVQGANQLTAQLVQVGPSDAVLSGPASALGMSTSDLRGVLSFGAQAQQNILQISATAGSKAQAQARAAAVTAALVAYVGTTSRRQLQAYTDSVQGVLTGMGTALGRLNAAKGKLTPAQLGVIQGEAGAIASQDQALRAQLAQRAAATTPIVTQVSGASSASKVSPQPVLYTIVAFLVVGFIALQLVYAGAWRPRQG